MSSPANSGYRGMKKYVVTQSTAEKIADSLCKMRGAALKLGQALSSMEESVIPPEIKTALERARAEADFLPDDQLESALKEAYGERWRDNFASFNMDPIAAASIGQVHEATLKDSNEKVVVKIQYPGIAECVDQDIDNFRAIFKCIFLAMGSDGIVSGGNVPGQYGSRYQERV